MVNNQTKNPLLMFGTPSKVHINGIEIEKQQIDVVIKALGAFSRAVKAMTISKINGIVKLKAEIYSHDDNKKRFANQYGVNVEDYCQKHACMDCEYFNHTYMTEINRNCPLLRYKEAVRDTFCLNTILSEVIFKNSRGGGYGR